jgi:hypothetical protein
MKKIKSPSTEEIPSNNVEDGMGLVQAILW